MIKKKCARRLSKTVGNIPGRRKIAKAVRGTRIAPRSVNRDNTLANWVSGMATEGGQRRETLAGWGDDTI
jgi:hypothetical protein